jgi:outer membrane murein-binding lipoprotein Lpp
MDLSDLKTWTDGLSVVGKAPHIVFPLMGAVAVAVWWFRGTVERARRDGLQSTIDGRESQIAGLNAQIAVMQERLQLANDAQKDLTTKLADAKAEFEKLKKQTEEKAPPEAIAATARSTASFLTDSVSANTVLHRLLEYTPPTRVFLYPMQETRVDDKPPPVTAPSE